MGLTVIQDGKITGSASAPVLISTGQYTGNSTQNRAIAHGLGITPKIIIISSSSGNISSVVSNKWHNGSAQYTVTAMDSINFYIGTASPDFFGNTNPNVYNWVAIATGGS